MSQLVTEEILEGIKDIGFRNRFVAEYATARAWSNKLQQPAPTVLDYGCGQGIGALGFALRLPAAQIHGVDLGTYFDALPRLAEQNLGCKVPANLALQAFNGRDLPFADAQFDLVYSWSVFEHIRRDMIPAVLAGVKRVLKLDGHFFIQIDPLYFSARGAHLYNCLPTPWVHLLLQHDVLREALMAHPSSEISKAHLWEQYESLNRLTVGKLQSEIEANGFQVERMKVDKYVQSEPPASLLEIYNRDVLETGTVYLLATPRSS